MTNEYKIFTCDRCGFEKRTSLLESAQMPTRLPERWGVVSDDKGRRDLCPQCFKEYRELVTDFMNRKKSRYKRRENIVTD